MKQVIPHRGPTPLTEIPLAGKREVGLVTLGRRRSVPVVFGEEKDISVVGVTALEIFGLEVC